MNFDIFQLFTSGSTSWARNGFWFSYPQWVSLSWTCSCELVQISCNGEPLTKNLLWFLWRITCYSFESGPTLQLLAIFTKLFMSLSPLLPPPSPPPLRHCETMSECLWSFCCYSLHLFQLCYISQDDLRARSLHQNSTGFLGIPNSKFNFWLLCVHIFFSLQNYLLFIKLIWMTIVSFEPITSFVKLIFFFCFDLCALHVSTCDLVCYFTGYSVKS